MYDHEDPRWFSGIPWGPPTPLYKVHANRALLPPEPGIYVFSEIEGIWLPGENRFRLARGTEGGNLYVATTRRSGIRQRLTTYLPGMPRTRGFTPSRAKARMMEEIERRTAGGVVGAGLWLRFAPHWEPEQLESPLVQYLRPVFNLGLEKVGR